MAVDRHAGHRIPIHPPLKRAGAYPTTTGIRHLAEVLTEPPASAAGRQCCADQLWRLQHTQISQGHLEFGAPPPQPIATRRPPPTAALLAKRERRSGLSCAQRVTTVDRRLNLTVSSS